MQFSRQNLQGISWITDTGETVSLSIGDRVRVPELHGPQDSEIVGAAWHDGCNEPVFHLAYGADVFVSNITEKL